MPDIEFNEYDTPEGFMADNINPNHYTDMKISPNEYITQNNLGWEVGNTIKYVSRYKNKNGKEDLEKAIKYIELLIEREYGKDECISEKNNFKIIEGDMFTYLGNDALSRYFTKMKSYSIKCFDYNSLKYELLNDNQGQCLLHEWELKKYFTRHGKDS